MEIVNLLVQWDVWVVADFPPPIFWFSLLLLPLTTEKIFVKGIIFR